MKPDLHFLVTGAEVVPFAASPHLVFKLNVRQTGAALAIHAAILRCQIRIEPMKRRYNDIEEERLRDLFDRRNGPGKSPRSMLWTTTSVTLPSFDHNIAIELPVPCTFDFNVATTRYFHAVDGGEAPLTLLFSGTVFHETTGGALQVSQLPCDKETTFRLPIRVWEEMMAQYYPNTAWLCLQRDAFDRLEDYKRRLGLPSWEAAIERLTTGSLALAGAGKRGNDSDG